ncbi:hypothetical protein BDF22DRAFT_665846 [Syncephalis plumigaleata]|nr:hypothetical protein BDF22DRAFT_665846 [Syncephalis plumigaleata]
MMGRIRTSARTLWRRSTTSSVDFIRTEDSSPYDDATVSTTTTQTAAAAIMAAATASRENTHIISNNQRRSRTRLNRRATTHIPSPLTSSPSHSLALSEQNAHAILSPPFMNPRVRTSISANRAITDSAATAAILSATSRPGGTYQRDEAFCTTGQTGHTTIATVARSSHDTITERAYDAEELVNRASSVLNNVLDDVHTLPDRFTCYTTANNNQEVPLSSNGHTVNDHNDRIKDLDGVPFVTTLGDFIAVVDLVARLLEEAVELQHTLNSMTLSYVQTVEERSREAVGADYIGDALHEVWQRIRQSDRTRAHVYQTMPHRRGASTIRPGTWADWARQQFGGLRRQQMRQGNTISPQRGTISDDVTNGAYGRRRPRLITFQQQQQQQQQSASSSNTTTQLNEGTTSSSTSANTNANNNTSIPPAPILTARDVLLNRAEWLSSSDADANNTASNNRAQEDGNHHSTTHARLRQRRETIAIAEQFASTQRTSCNSNDGNAAPNNSINNSHVTT